MALLSAIASGPISFIASGQQQLIPLTSFGFNDTTGAIEFIAPAPSFATEALTWLEQLRQWGFIRPSTKPARRLAMLIQAVDAGVEGNEVTVEFTPTGATFTMEVTATHIYPEITLGELKKLLGTETLPGTQPGLVRFRDADMTTFDFPAAVSDAIFSGGSDGAPVPAASTTADIEKAGSPGVFAFRLAARKPGLGGNDIKATITHSLTPNKLTLTVIWHHVKTGLDPNAALAGTFQTEFGYLISVSPPDGNAFAMPDAGTITLSGGTEAAKASARPVTP